MIKVGPELIRFGILVDGEDIHQVQDLEGLSTYSVEQKLVELVKKAKGLASELPKGIKDDIISGKFTQRIQHYK